MFSHQYNNLKFIGYGIYEVGFEKGVVTIHWKVSPIIYPLKKNSSSIRGIGRKLLNFKA
jgi:hypothetical protein